MSDRPLNILPTEKVEEIRARAEKATPGPWYLDTHFQCYIWGPKMQMVADDGNPPADENEQITRMRGVGADLPLEANGQFIAHARTDIPALLASHDAQARRIEELEADATTWSSALMERTAQLIAHRACCGTEHDPSVGKFHGYCVVCGVPWPCDIAAIQSTKENGNA